MAINCIKKIKAGDAIYVGPSEYKILEVFFDSTYRINNRGYVYIVGLDTIIASEITRIVKAK